MRDSEDGFHTVVGVFDVPAEREMNEQHVIFVEIIVLTLPIFCARLGSWSKGDHDGGWSGRSAVSEAANNFARSCQLPTTLHSAALFCRQLSNRTHQLSIGGRKMATSLLLLSNCIIPRLVILES